MVTVAVTRAVPAEETDNGKLTFSLTSNELAPPVWSLAGCPNENWTARYGDLSFRVAVIRIDQPEGTTVLTTRCLFTPYTSDGEVPADSSDCSTE